MEKNKGGRPRNPVNVFDLGFPISSRSGLEYVNQWGALKAKKLADMHGRAGFYGQQELQALAEPLISQWTSVMGPAEQSIAAARGTLDVMRQAALGKADVELMLARQKAEALGIRPPSPGGLPVSGPVATRPAPTAAHASPAVPAAVGAPGALSASPEICYVYRNATGFCTSNLPPSSPQIVSQGVSFIAGPMSCLAAISTYGGGHSLPVCAPVSGTGVPGQSGGMPGGTLVSQPAEPPTAPFPGPTGEQHCPSCGCPLTLDDLLKAPGSSCDKPFFIVQCAPKKKPKACPPPKPTRPTTLPSANGAMLSENA